MKDKLVAESLNEFFAGTATPGVILPRYKINKVTQFPNELWSKNDRNKLTFSQKGTYHVMDRNRNWLPKKDRTPDSYISALGINKDTDKWSDEYVNGTKQILVEIPAGGTNLFKNNRRDEIPILLCVSEGGVRIVQSFYYVANIFGHGVLLEEATELNKSL